MTEDQRVIGYFDLGGEKEASPCEIDVADLDNSRHSELQIMFVNELALTYVYHNHTIDNNH